MLTLAERKEGERAYCYTRDGAPLLAGVEVMGAHGRVFVQGIGRSGRTFEKAGFHGLTPLEARLLAEAILQEIERT